MPDVQTVLLSPAGQAAPTTLEAYRSAGGYAALRKALTTLTPSEVTGEIRAAQLRGRGGAGVLAAEKLALVARTEADAKYLICNAYDADPRSLVAATLLEQYPHLVLEGMALAAYAIGATEGFLYIRGSNAAASAAVQKALSEAVEQGVLGRAMLGSPVDFAVTLVAVERGFMGGEESTMIEIIKGKPMKAQQRPPYPAKIGLFSKPTAVQNIETLANLPWIFTHSGKDFSAIGSKNSPGTKLVTVYGAGASDAEGRLVEVPFGVSLQQILRVAGAEANESVARGVVVGGKEGGVVPLSLLNTPFDFEPLDAAGCIVGSSVLEVVPARTCMAHWAMERTEYLAGETCGKCVPCRVGVKRVAGTLEGVISSLGAQDDMALLEEFSRYIPDGSLCGFGVNAVHPVVTAMKYFADDFTAHMAGRCAMGTCTPVRAHRYATKHVL